MRDLFPGHYTPTDQQFSALWKDALIVLDANVLLDFFRIPQDKAKNFLDVIEKLKGRIWVPHRAAAEYHKNLDNVIMTQAKACHDAAELLRKSEKQLDEALRNGRSYPFLPQGNVSALQKAHKSVIDELEKQAASFRGLIDRNPLKDQIAAVFSGVVGQDLSPEEKKAAIKEGVQRGTAQSPPGYLDFKNKRDSTDEDKVGDYLCWRQTISKATKEKRSVIFVTNDMKDDWARNIQGRSYGPRPELVQEFYAETSQSFWLYDSEQFLRYANQHLSTQVSQDTLNQVKAVKDTRAADREARIQADLASAFIASDPLGDLRQRIKLAQDPGSERSRIAQAVLAEHDPLFTLIRRIFEENNIVMGNPQFPNSDPQEE